MSDESTAVEAQEKEPGIVEFVTAASIDKDARKVTLRYDVGSNLDDAKEKNSPEVVYGLYVDKAIIVVQGFVRRLLKGEKYMTDEEIQKAVDEYKLGVKQPRMAGDKLDKVALDIAKLSPDKRAEFLAKLKAKIEAATAAAQ